MNSLIAETAAEMVPATEAVPQVSWKELQYPAGSIGHRKPQPTVIDKDKQNEYLKKILSSKVYDVAVETPLQLAPLLSKKLGVNLWLKRDDEQQIFSFKIRGAYNNIYHLPKDPSKKGVICASAGNHAQGVAYSARELKIEAHIVMPNTTPKIKVDAVTRLDGQVELCGHTFSDAMKRAKKRAEDEGLTYVPSDVEYSIAGQGSVGMEIARQMKDEIHAIFVPIGGGGLICGIASYFKMVYPKVKIFGVQPNDSNAMAQAIHRGHIVNVTDIGQFAEGVAIQQVGPESFRICNELIDDVILVDKHQISAAIVDMFNDGRNILEPSGALSIAAAKAYCEYNNISKTKGVNVVAVTTGANINFDELGHISEYAKVDQSILATKLPERPGSLRALINFLDEDTNITEISYRFGSKDALIIYKITLVGEEVENLVKRLNSSDFKTKVLKDNPVVTEHLRYMTGGGANIEDESLFRFIFPEKAGALRHFLKDFQSHWNITLIHCRQQGIITTDVLIGIQMKKSEEREFQLEEERELKDYVKREEKEFKDYVKTVGYRYEQVSPDVHTHLLE